MGETITLSKDTAYGAVIAVLVVLLAVSVFTQGFGIVKAVPTPVVNAGGNGANGGATAGGATGGAATGGAQPTQDKLFKLPSLFSKVPVLGTSTSGVTLLEFADFQCPWCGMMWGKNYAPQYSTIIGSATKFKQEYVSTGKANYAYTPVAFLGLSQGSTESVDSANAVLCANDQGKFYEMEDAIFAAQDSNENSGKYAPAKLKAIAQNVTGIDQTKFGACVDAKTHDNEISAFTQDWETTSQANTGNAGTPTVWFVVDASKFSADKVSAAASAAGFQSALTDDKSSYLVIASPDYTALKQFTDKLLG